MWARAPWGCWPRVWSTVGTREHSVFRGAELQPQPRTLSLSFPAPVPVKSSFVGVCYVVVIPIS